MKTILLVEDDLSLIEGLCFSLQRQNFDVTVARTVAEAERSLNNTSYDLIILDVMLPDGNGFELCKSIRLRTDIPIVFLTASDEEVNVVMGLDIGADDYVTKPFKLNELISRINAALRRYGSSAGSPDELCSNGITVRLLEGRVVKDGIELELTPAEFKLLCLFMQNPRIVLSRDQIMQRLWDRESFVDDNTLAVYISRLRDKIEDVPRQPAFLTTIRGMGYKWNIS
ncbi:MAG: response regulator transcription factor [Syntrophomonadaceae bacterium]